MFDLTKEDQSKKQEKKFSEIFAKLQHTESLLDKLFEGHGLTEEEFNAFFENPNHFYPETWEELQKANKQLNQKLELDLKFIKDSHSTAQKYKTLSSAKNWMFVR